MGPHQIELAITYHLYALGLQKVPKRQEWPVLLSVRRSRLDVRLAWPVPDCTQNSPNCIDSFSVVPLTQLLAIKKGLGTSHLLYANYKHQPRGPEGGPSTRGVDSS